MKKLINKISVLIVFMIALQMIHAQNEPPNIRYLPLNKQLEKKPEKKKSKKEKKQKIVKIAEKQNVMLNKPAVIDKVKESVVWIHAFGMPALGTSSQYSYGSGYVVDNGLIVTNHHVVDGANGIVVYARNSKNYDRDEPFYATVVWSDPSIDLAVIKAYGLNIERQVKFADPNKTKQGDEVVILGFPVDMYSEKEMKVSWGLISNNPRSGIIQTNAAINVGNSGGPAVNLYGEVVGTVSHKLNKTKAGVNIEGIGYLINSGMVKDGIIKAKLELTSGEPNLHGAKNLNSYKKFCDAEISAWNTMLPNITNEEKLHFYDNSKKLIVEALKIDPNFSEAHIFLASYLLQEAVIYCMSGKNVQADELFRYSHEEYLKAEKTDYTVRYTNSEVANEFKKFWEQGDFNCEMFNQAISDKKENEKIMREEEFKEWLETGKPPEKLINSLLKFSR